MRPGIEVQTSYPYVSRERYVSFDSPGQQELYCVILGPNATIRLSRQAAERLSRRLAIELARRERR